LVLRDARVWKASTLTDSIRDRIQADHQRYKEQEMRPDATTHYRIHPRMGRHAACGAKVAGTTVDEAIEGSTDELRRVTCPHCRHAIRDLVRQVNVCKRGKTAMWLSEKESK